MRARRALARVVRRARRPAPAAPDPDAPLDGWPAGHFYSPLLTRAEIERHRERVLGSTRPSLPGIALDLEEQLATLGRVAEAAAGAPWRDAPHGPWRFGYDNPNFGPGEALVLLGMLALARPRRVVEVGSGWSTAALLDANDLVLGGRAELTAVEPYPELLRSLLRPGDRLAVHEGPVQEVPLATFTALEAGDVLFIDSSHVARFGSDVVHLVGEVLPALAPGVRVHIHDMFHPFEYPLAWLEQGRAWNEAYVVRAFLTHNDAFEIELFSDYVWALAPERAGAVLPGASGSPGSSLWLRRR